MKHVLTVITLVLVSSLTAFSQTDNQKGLGKKLKDQSSLTSPMMGFIEKSGDPLRMLYVGTYAVKKNAQEVEIKLEPRNSSGKAIRTFTVYCEEELKQTKDNGLAKQVHRFTAKETQPVHFQVRKDSLLTFRVAVIEFEDGTVWAHDKL